MDKEPNRYSQYHLITKSDTVDIPSGPAIGIYVGGTGDVNVVDIKGGAILFSAVPAGTILPVLARRVNSTGTSASLMVALF